MVPQVVGMLPLGMEVVALNPVARARMPRMESVTFRLARL